MSMQIHSLDGSAILDYPGVTRALLRIYEPGDVSAPVFTAPPFPDSFIDVTPQSEPPFQVSVADDHASCGMDGLPAQNLRVAVSLRAELPEAASRLILLDLDSEKYADLPWGVTADQVEAGWRSLDELEDVWPS